MSFNYVRLPNLTITNGNSTSNAVWPTDDAYGIGLISPPTLTSSVAYVEVEMTDTGVNFVRLQSGGADITLAASKAIVMTPFPYKQFRVTTTAVEGGDRTFTASRVVPV